MFCDLVGSTALSAQLDPEEYREVVRAYQETVRQSFNAMGGTLRSTWAMGCSSISAIRPRMKMMRSGRYGRDWRSWLRPSPSKSVAVQPTIRLPLSRYKSASVFTPG